MPVTRAPNASDQGPKLLLSWLFSVMNCTLELWTKVHLPPLSCVFRFHHSTRKNKTSETLTSAETCWGHLPWSHAIFFITSLRSYLVVTHSSSCPSHLLFSCLQLLLPQTSQHYFLPELLSFLRLTPNLVIVSIKLWKQKSACVKTSQCLKTKDDFMGTSGMGVKWHPTVLHLHPHVLFKDSSPGPPCLSVKTSPSFQ